MGVKKTPITEKDYNILKKVADKNNFSLKELMLVYSKESDSGSNLHRKGSGYYGPFQFGEGAISTINQNRKSANKFTLNDAKTDLSKSAQAYIDYVGINKKAFATAKKRYGIVSEPMLEGFDQTTKNYLMHQQGAYGLASIMKTIAQNNPHSYATTRSALMKDGAWGTATRPSSNTREAMLGNLTSAQKKFFIDSTKTVPEASQYFLNSVKNQLIDIEGQTDSSIKKYSDDTSFFFPDENVMNEALG
tara:strand:- start:964 stop:1704 length:741 start_codon:yes stop_codon:yes gene_type:complete